MYHSDIGDNFLLISFISSTLYTAAGTFLGARH